MTPKQKLAILNQKRLERESKLASVVDTMGIPEGAFIVYHGSSPKRLAVTVKFGDWSNILEWLQQQEIEDDRLLHWSCQYTNGSGMIHSQIVAKINGVLFKLQPSALWEYHNKQHQFVSAKVQSGKYVWFDFSNNLFKRLDRSVYVGRKDTKLFRGTCGFGSFSRWVESISS